MRLMPYISGGEEEGGGARQEKKKKRDEPQLERSRKVADKSDALSRNRRPRISATATTTTAAAVETRITNRR